MTMRILPAIDIRGGRCVRLQQGDFSRQTVYAPDPVTQAKSYQADGATHLHVVDLDGARSGKTANLKQISAIAAGTSLSMQCGGGIRDRATARHLLAAGVKRLVVGSVAAGGARALEPWIEEFGGERLCLALDVLTDGDDYEIATHGWQARSGRSLFTTLDECAALGIRHILCTAIDRDGTLSGPDITIYRALHRRFPELAIQASGGVCGLRDIRELAQAGITAVVIGKALLEGKFNLAEALACLPAA